MKFKILIIFIFSSTFSFGQSAHLIDSFIKKEMVERQIPGLSLAIIQNGKVIHKNAYGYSVIEHQVPAKIETIYEVASITKQFIATGILLLVQDGLIDLDKPIEIYLDSLPDKWNLLTLRQMLSHTAGLAPEEEEFKSLKKGGWPKHVTREMMWNSINDDSIFAVPGSQFSYHYAGFYFAVLIIEKITQKDHRVFFDNRIFKRLNMKSTYFEDQIKVIPNQASGYTLKNSEIVKIWRVGQEDIGAGAGLYSCIDDMIKWNKSIRNNTILQPDDQNRMFRRSKLNNGLPVKYGLGWWLSERNGVPFYYHNGITGPEFLKVPSIDLDIIILSNLGQGDFDAVHYWGLAHKLAGIFFDERLRHPPPSETLDSIEFQFFTGTFEYESEGELVVYVRGDKLYLKDGFGESLMIYKGNNAFTLTNDPVIFKYLTKDRIQVIEELWNDDFANRKN